MAESKKNQSTEKQTEPEEVTVDEKTLEQLQRMLGVNVRTGEFGLAAPQCCGKDGF
jgi:hypothetical protein